MKYKNTSDREIIASSLSGTRNMMRVYIHRILLSVAFIISACTAIHAQVMAVDSVHRSAGAWYCFRNRYKLDGSVKDCQLRIAADTKYWLWINGKLTVREGGLKRGPNPKDTYCDVIRNVRNLKRGNNSIALLVWYFGKDGFSHRNSPTPGICVEMKQNNATILPTGKWKWRRHPAYYVPKGKQPNFRLAESNIGFDADKDIDFEDPEYDDSQWDTATVMTPEGAGWNALAERPIPFWKDYGLKRYVRTETSGDTLKAYLPYNAQVTPYLRIRCRAGETVGIQTDDYMGGSELNVRAEYRTKDGVQEFECRGWMNGHTVYYILPKGAKVTDVKYRETGFDTDMTGKFDCDDSLLNRLWRKAQRTLYITMRDNYMDCPDRERAQWWGDVVNEQGEAFYAMDEKAHLLTRKGIRELMDWQRADSTIYAPVPSGNYASELPMQMLASVGYYGFWTYFMGTADSSTIDYVFPKVRKYIHVWETDDEGLVVPRKGGWTWGDWGENKDMTLLYNEWYIIALKGYERMAMLTGCTDEAAWAKKTAERMKTAFHQKFWRGTYYMSTGFKGVPDDRAQALAVVADILPRTLYPTIRNVFSQQYHASPYMEKYVLEALCRMGYSEDALTRMKSRFREMADSKLSTLWEGWGIGTNGYGGGTTNHAWSGGPLTVMSQCILGIEPAAPGFAVVRLSPHPASLKRIHAVLPLSGGRRMDIRLRQTEEEYCVDVDIPQGTKVELVMPAEYREMNVDGKTPAGDTTTIEAGKWRIRLKK